MNTEPAPASRWHFGRTWWITILTIVIDAVLGLLVVNGHAKPEDVAVPAIAITAAAASHNFGRAWEDGQRNANPNVPGSPPDPKPPRPGHELKNNTGVKK